MTEKPILFSPEMVRAILKGHKTQTRRIVKPQPIIEADGRMHWKGIGWTTHHSRLTAGTMLPQCPYGIPGCQLWVRETWSASPSCIELKYIPDVLYRADNWPAVPHKWRPSIFMPRWVSRIQLEIINIRIERVQSITLHDAIDEGMTCDLPFCNQQEEYEDLWDQLNKKRGFGWEVNPWVWVIEFKRVEDK